MNRLNWLTAVFFILAIALYGAIEWHQSNKTEEPTVVQDLTPDYIAEQLNSDSYDESGNLAYVIDAARMEHYASLDITHFEFPEYTLYPQGEKQPWKITANEGTLYASNRVRLQNRVKLEATDTDSILQEIHGKYLELDLNTNILSSEQTIVIQGKGFTMYGSGIIVDLNTKQWTLTEHVQSVYSKDNN